MKDLFTKLTLYFVLPLTLIEILISIYTHNFYLLIENLENLSYVFLGFGVGMELGLTDNK